MNTRNRLFVALVVCAVAGSGALGCNTIRGAGRDIQRGGKAVENAANDVDNTRDPRRHREFTLVALAESGGSITPSGSTKVSYGSDVTYLIKADSGYRLTDVIIDGRSVGAVGRYTFRNVNTGHTISALFTAESNR